MARPRGRREAINPTHKLKTVLSDVVFGIVLVLMGMIALIAGIRTGYVLAIVLGIGFLIFGIRVVQKRARRS